MLETLYVMTPGISIRQDGGLLVLEKDHSVIKEIPIKSCIRPNDSNFYAGYVFFSEARFSHSVCRL